MHIRALSTISLFLIGLCTACNHPLAPETHGAGEVADIPLRIAVTPDTEVLVTRLANAFPQGNPRIEFDVDVVRSDRALPMIRARDVDMAVMSSAPTEADGKSMPDAIVHFALTGGGTVKLLPPPTAKGTQNVAVPTNPNRTPYVVVYRDKSDSGRQWAAGQFLHWVIAGAGQGVAKEKPLSKMAKEAALKELGALSGAGQAVVDLKQAPSNVAPPPVAELPEPAERSPSNVAPVPEPHDAETDPAQDAAAAPAPDAASAN